MIFLGGRGDWEGLGSCVFVCETSHLSHEVLIAHQANLLGRRFGHRHKEDVNARLSG